MTLLDIEEVEGWMRGSHYGPLIPVPIRQAMPNRFDGPPCVIAFGFQLSGGQLIDPRDVFADPVFDEARNLTNIINNNQCRHGHY